jgi:hypothetical protein
VRWTESEKVLFALAGLQNTDINVLEFITAILAIVTERHFLQGKTVVLRVDNTAAVAWLNQSRTNHIWGQSWVRVLVVVCLHFHIKIIAEHIPGLVNVTADGLSRFFQEIYEELLQDGLSERVLPSASWREGIWQASGKALLWEEWSRLHGELTPPGSTL